MTTHKRFTNLTDFNFNVMNVSETDNEEFQIIEESQIFNQSKYQEKDLLYLTEEDEKIKAKMFDLTSVFNKCMPKLNIKEKENLFKDLQAKLNHSDKKMYCKNHPKIQISYVCINNSCPFSFFCNKCLKDHKKSCDKINMYLNPSAISSEEYCTEIFDETDFDEETELKKVKDIVEEKRKKINQQLDGIIKLSEDKLRSQSKEYKLHYFCKVVKEKVDEFESNKTYVNLLDLAHESFKLDMIFNMEDLPSIDEQVEILNISLNRIEKDVDDSVKKFKKSFIKSLEDNKKQYVDYWQELLNIKHHNQMVKAQPNNDYKILSNVNFPKMTKKQNKPEKYIEVESQASSNFIENEIKNVLGDLKNDQAPEEIQPITNKDQDFSSMLFEGTVIIQGVKDSLKKYTKDSFEPLEIDYIAQTIIPDEFKSLKLKYRISSSKGFIANKFHAKSKDVCPTIMLCVTKEGRKFGGVNYLPWGEGHDEKLTDKNFIFSIDEKSKHDLKVQSNGQYKGSKMTNDAIDFDDSTGPIFGDDDLVIGDECTVKESCTSNLGNTYYFDKSKGTPNTYLAQKENFSLKALYLFQMNTIGI